MVSFAALLAGHLVRQGWNGTTFALQVGYSQSYLSKILRGQKPPPLAMVERWSMALRLSAVEAQRLRLAAVVAQAPDEVITLMTLLAQGSPNRLGERAERDDVQVLRELLLGADDTGPLEQLRGRGRRREDPSHPRGPQQR